MKEGEVSTVTAILDPAVYSGTGKNGKPFSQSMVELENGAQTRLFNPIKVGDKVESYKNGTYVNWRIVKQDKVDQAELLKIVQFIYDDIQLIKRMVGVEDRSKDIAIDDI